MGTAAEIAALRKAIEETTPFGDAEKEYCTDHTLRRYLIARNLNVEKAKKLLRETLDWRTSFKVNEIDGKSVYENGRTGKIFVSGIDLTGRPVVYMRPVKENTQMDHDGNLRHLVYHMTRAEKALDEDGGIGKLIVILDCHDYSKSNAPPLKTSHATLNILQNHFPERLGQFIILEAPWYFHAIYAAISPFIDSVTKKKIVFIKGDDHAARRKMLSAYFDMSHIPRELYGDADLTSVFNPEEYYTAAGEAAYVQDVRAARAARRLGSAPAT